MSTVGLMNKLATKICQLIINVTNMVYVWHGDSFSVTRLAPAHGDTCTRVLQRLETGAPCGDHGNLHAPVVMATWQVARQHGERKHGDGSDVDTPGRESRLNIEKQGTSQSHGYDRWVIHTQHPGPRLTWWNMIYNRHWSYTHLCFNCGSVLTVSWH